MRNTINDLRTAGFLEGMSYILLLGVAMPLKYIAGAPLGVRIVGSLHGALFLIYVLLGLRAAKIYKWPAIRVFYLFLASVLPFGPFVFDRSLKQEEQSSPIGKENH